MLNYFGIDSIIFKTKNIRERNFDMLTFIYFLPFIITTALFILVMKRDSRTIMTGILFVLSLLFLFVGLHYLVYKYSKTIDAMLPFAATVSSISKIIMAIIGLVPTIMIIITVIYGLMVIKREGVSTRNAKTLGFAMILIFYTVLWPLLGGLKISLYLDIIYVAASLMVFYFIMLKSMYTATSIINLLHRSGGKDLDYLIYIGAGMRGEQADSLTEKRVEKTYEKWLENPRAIIVVTGGSKRYDTIPKTDEIAGMLEEKGIPGEAIIIDDKSHKTNADIRRSKMLIEEDLGFAAGPEDEEELSRREYKKARKAERKEWKKGILNSKDAPKIAIISSNYHVLRCLIVARHYRMKCIGYGAPVRIDYRMNAFVNEYYSYLRVSKRAHRRVLCLIAFLFFLLLVYVFFNYDHIQQYYV